MSRGVGLAEAIRSALPEWAAVVVGLATQLGDFWFLALLLGAAYLWRPTDRDGVAFVGGLALVGVGVIQTVKAGLGWRRPPMAGAGADALTGIAATAYDLTVPAGGFGFPSGHALMAAVVYLGLAMHLSLGSRERRLPLAGLVVLVVATSRVMLGVHYLVDVISGVTIGVAIVAGGAVLQRHLGAGAVPITLAVAGGFALLNLVIRGLTGESIALLVAVAAFGAWRLARPGGTSGPPTDRTDLRGLGLVGLVVVGVLVLVGLLAWIGPAGGVGG